MELKKYQLMVLTLTSAYVRNNCTIYNNVKQVRLSLLKLKGHYYYYYYYFNKGYQLTSDLLRSSIYMAFLLVLFTVQLEAATNH